MAGTCDYGEGLSGSINAENYWCISCYIYIILNEVQSVQTFPKDLTLQNIDIYKPQNTDLIHNYISYLKILYGKNTEQSKKKILFRLYAMHLLGTSMSTHIILYLTLRRLMSYIYMEHPFLMFLDHTQRRSTVGRTPLDE